MPGLLPPHWELGFFFRPQFYLQTVLLHLANRSESKGSLAEEWPVVLLCGEWVYGNRVWQQTTTTTTSKRELYVKVGR
jgi:hypothetical protein